MFTKRIIPCLDVNDGRVVKGINFVNLRDAGDPVEVAAAYDKAGADEVVFLEMQRTSLAASVWYSPLMPDEERMEAAGMFTKTAVVLIPGLTL